MGDERLSYKEQRKKAGYSQKTVADLLGISVSAVSLYETGKADPSVAVLHKLSALYRCTLDELMKGEGRK
jgi:DNA-binding helix-turn-helix protein|nr:MAG TPA: Helix-turn-helix XRE-family like protein [Caudoviricetes sp.]